MPKTAWCNKMAGIPTHKERKKMGHAGQPMKVVKANRALLSKRNTFKKVKNMFIETAVRKTELQFNEVSAEKLYRIKREIREKAKKDAWKEAGLYVVCIAVVTYCLYWALYL
ncbi:hypothetical protein FGM00_16035 [Aggregatimonas sangjinii]|uniref:Uncharacterized protein n=1 Tax=Aggregatimonas sangjinii TaxID=2583587 RepID=A0A5B7STL1_9FLAO|nr:hypothetical protein [Aggregatimonas sangjinii]QCX01542.1 hypothetical protein FGM00_16035 [Aggregatimonas sangjinii]